jgi:hypothetical protein
MRSSALTDDAVRQLGAFTAAADNLNGICSLPMATTSHRHRLT